MQTELPQPMFKFDDTFADFSIGLDTPQPEGSSKLAWASLSANRDLQFSNPFPEAATASRGSPLSPDSSETNIIPSIMANTRINRLNNARIPSRPLPSRNSQYQFGQITPPEEKSHTFHGRSASISLPVAPTIESEYSDRRDSAGSTATLPSSNQQSAQRQPKKRNRNASSSGATGENPEKREEFLRRNREAAQKSREKKRKYTQKLNDQKMGHVELNAKLKIQKDDLEKLILDLKDMALMHENCGCSAIREYMQNQFREKMRISAGGQPMFQPDFTHQHPQSIPATMRTGPVPDSPDHAQTLSEASSERSHSRQPSLGMPLSAVGPSLDAGAQSVDLRDDNFTPISEEFAGQPIEPGNMDMNLDDDPDFSMFVDDMVASGDYDRADT